MNTPKRYSSDLTDSQWELIKPLLDYKRKRTNDLREIAKAVADRPSAVYLVKTGCQWRMIPNNFRAWQTVRYYYDRWCRYGVIDRALRRLRGLARRQAGRRTSPSAAVIDSQSVKTSLVGGSARGFDNFMADGSSAKVKGRKRHIPAVDQPAVDTTGLLLAVIVHAANAHESKTALKVLEMLYKRHPRLRRIWADRAYQGDLVETVRARFGWILEIVQRAGKGFQVMRRRWVVERTLAWFEGYRRLSKDYERLPQNSEAMVKLAMIRLMLQRVA